MRRFTSISEFLQFRGLPKLDHPLIYVSKVEAVERMLIEEPKSWVYDFYAVALKRVANAADVQLKYGQQAYNYDSGIMSFVAPGQVLSLVLDEDVKKIKQSGWMLLVHPDFLWHTSLAKTIKEYDFWDYSVHEALFLSEKEEATLVHILKTIQQECQLNIDAFTKSIIISHLETLLNYADRFYHRQFITREKTHHQLLERFEKILNEYFDDTSHLAKGLPTVRYLAGKMNLSPKYLSSLLKVLTGQNTQQHIHEKLIQKAKEKLSTTHLSVSEIAYQLGFEHLQSFSKLFKNKTAQSPVEFRESFN
jgi:AraC family transcriptional regulator, transcriptional activator of pobA